MRSNGDPNIPPDRSISTTNPHYIDYRPPYIMSLRKEFIKKFFNDRDGIQESNSVLLEMRNSIYGEKRYFNRIQRSLNNLIPQSTVQTLSELINEIYKNYGDRRSHDYGQIINEFLQQIIYYEYSSIAKSMTLKRVLDSSDYRTEISRVTRNYISSGSLQRDLLRFFVEIFGISKKKNKSSSKNIIF